MKPLSSLDMFMIGTYSESMMGSDKVCVSDFNAIAQELLYINPNYYFDSDLVSVKEWAEYFQCYDEKMKSIMLNDKVIERVKSYQDIARKININIYEDFAEASQNFHRKKGKSLKLGHWF